MFVLTRERLRDGDLGPPVADRLSARFRVAPSGCGLSLSRAGTLLVDVGVNGPNGSVKSVVPDADNARDGGCGS